MSGYTTNIEQKTLENKYFRQVLFTGKHIQLVVMSIAPGEEIGTEIHDHVDQFFRVEAGHGKAVYDGKEVELADGDILVIVAGTEHNVINTSTSEPLQLYTLYAPPNHPDGTINKDKAEAEEYEKKMHGH
jgi:mannose-6-phosphate isomerase-like protein (cupin superfamily)